MVLHCEFYFKFWSIKKKIIKLSNQEKYQKKTFIYTEDMNSRDSLPVDSILLTHLKYKIHLNLSRNRPHLAPGKELHFSF